MFSHKVHFILIVFLICFIGCSNDSIHDEIVRLRVKQGEIKKQLETSKEKQGMIRNVFNDNDEVDKLQAQLKVLNERIEALEGQKGGFNGPLAVIAIVILAVVVPVIIGKGWG